MNRNGRKKLHPPPVRGRHFTDMISMRISVDSNLGAVWTLGRDLPKPLRQELHVGELFSKAEKLSLKRDSVSQ